MNLDDLLDNMTQPKPIDEDEDDGWGAPAVVKSKP